MNDLPACLRDEYGDCTCQLGPLAADEIERLHHDAKLGKELEMAVCMYTHFTGERPYVGTKGLVLAIKEMGVFVAKVREADAMDAVDFALKELDFEDNRNDGETDA